MHFKKFKGLLDQISQVSSFPLTVINLITNVGILSLEKIHDWKNLSVIWDKSLANSIRACDQGLQDFQSNSNNFWVSGIQSSFNWDNQLWNNWQYLSSTFFKHIKYTLNSKESVWVHFLSNTFEKDWEIMMVIKLLNINFPVDFILWSMLDGHWKITSIVEKSEFRHWDVSSINSTSNWLLNEWLWLWLVQTNSLSSETITFLKNCGS